MLLGCAVKKIVCGFYVENGIETQGKEQKKGWMNLIVLNNVELREKDLLRSLNLRY